MPSKAIKMAIAGVGAIVLFGGATILFVTLKKRAQPPITEGVEKPGADKEKEKDKGTDVAGDKSTEKPDASESDKPKESEKTAKEGTPESDAGKSHENATTEKPAPAGAGANADAASGSSGAEAAVDVSFKLPSPYTEPQFSALMRQLESARTDLERRTASADVREATLERMRSDLDDRRDELAKLRDQILSKAKDLDDKRGRFDKEIVRLSTAEEANLRALASVYDEMPADAAAERLVALGTSEAAKILSRVEKKKTAKIIAAMPVDKASEVTAKLGKLLPVTPDDATPADGK